MPYSDTSEVWIYICSNIIIYHFFRLVNQNLFRRGNLFVGRSLPRNKRTGCPKSKVPPPRRESARRRERGNRKAKEAEGVKPPRARAIYGSFTEAVCILRSRSALCIGKAFIEDYSSFRRCVFHEGRGATNDLNVPSVQSRGTPNLGMSIILSGFTLYGDFVVYAKRTYFDATATASSL